MSNEITPTEAMIKYDLSNKGFRVGDLGILLKVGLVKGYKIHSQGVTYIDEMTLRYLLKRRDELLQQQMSNLNDEG